MLAEIGVVGDGVEGWGVEFGERGVGVLAVKTLLEAVDPDFVKFHALLEKVDRE